jgi:hypothetical protein
MQPGSLRYQLHQLVTETLPDARNAGTKRKAWWRIAGEAAALAAQWRCLPFHYARYGLYRDGVLLEQARSYLPETVLFARYLPAVNRDTVLLDDKVVCKRVLASAGIPQPRLLLSGDANGAVLPDGTSLTHEAVLGALPPGRQVVIKPARYSSAGRGVTIFSVDQAFSLSAYSARWGSWLVEDHLTQHPDLTALNPGPVNTFRIITCLSPVGAKTLFCMLKLGGSSQITDNSGAGGMQIRVDPATGELDAEGHDRHLRAHACHPATGIPFKGRSIRAIRDITDTAERAARLFPQTPFIGWDIALTPDGPSVVEGNSAPSLAHIQRTYPQVAPFLLGHLHPLRNRSLT